MTESDFWALSQDALGLLDAFAEYRVTGRYRQQDLEIVAEKLG